MREGEQFAGGTTAALGGGAHCARKELLRLAECGEMRSDSGDAKLRWRDIGTARVLAGPLDATRPASPACARHAARRT